MNTPKTLVQEFENLHQQLAVTTFAVSAYMDSNGDSDNIYDTAIHAQMGNNTRAAGKILDQLISFEKSKPEPVATDCKSHVTRTGKRPDYDQGVHLLEWLNANRTEINDQDKQWLKTSCSINKTFKNIHDQLFGIKPLMTDKNMSENKENIPDQQQSQSSEALSHLDIYDGLHEILDISEALESLGLENQSETVKGTEVSTLIGIISNKVEPLMARVLPMPDRSTKETSHVRC